MLVAHVITRLLRAGSEENTLWTCLRQAEHGHEVCLIHGHDFDDDLAREWSRRLQVIEVGSLVHDVNPLLDARALRELAWIFGRLRPDLVHTHQSKAGILGRVAARLAGVPNIVHGVHIVPFLNVGAAKRAIYVNAERAVAAFTDAFIDVSGGMQRACIDNGIGAADRHHVVYSGMDLARFREARAPAHWRSLLEIGPREARPPVVLMLASLEARKRHLELLAVFGRVVARFPEVRLLLAGEGTLRAAIEREIAARNLAKNVKLIGYQSRPEEIVALADVCLLTSMREGLPRSVVQYIAAARPVVVTHLAGIEEIVRHGFNGLIAPADDLELAIDVLCDLLADGELRSRLARGAAQSDLSRWEIDAMVRGIEEIYRRIDEPWDMQFPALPGQPRDRAQLRTAS